MSDIDFISIDFSDSVPATGDRQLLAANDYEFEVSGAVSQPSKAGNPMIVIESMVVGLADGAPSPEAGRKHKSYFPYTTKYGKDRFNNFLTAVDGHGEGNGFSPSALVGKRFIGTITHRTNTYTDPKTMEEKTGTNADLTRERPVNVTPPPSLASNNKKSGVTTQARR